jgi:hypothetical protein
MKTVTPTDFPLGPFGQLRVDKKTGDVGECCGSHFPPSGGLGEMTITFRPATGASREIPLGDLRQPTKEERAQFEKQTRESRLPG